MITIISGMSRGRKFTRKMTVRADGTLRNAEMRLVSVYPQVRYQEIHGFGGAFTDAAGYV